MAIPFHRPVPSSQIDPQQPLAEIPGYRSLHQQHSRKRTRSNRNDAFTL